MSVNTQTVVVSKDVISYKEKRKKRALLVKWLLFNFPNTKKISVYKVAVGLCWAQKLALCTCIFLLSTPDLGRDPLVTDKQAVEIKHTLKEPRSLTDPVWTTGHTRELRLRDACWRQANGDSSKISPTCPMFFLHLCLTPVQIASKTAYVNYILYLMGSNLDRSIRVNIYM